MSPFIWNIVRDVGSTAKAGRGVGGREGGGSEKRTKEEVASLSKCNKSKSSKSIKMCL